MTYAEGRGRGNARVDRRALSMAIKFSGLSKAEVARQAKVSPSTISNLLHSRNACSVETAAKIARALSVDTKDIFLLVTFNDVQPRSKAA